VHQPCLTRRPPPSLTTLGDCTFSECPKVASLSSLPAACTEVDRITFWFCTNVDALTGFRPYDGEDELTAFLRAQPFRYEFHFLCLDPNTTAENVKASYDSILNAERWVSEVGKDCNAQWSTSPAPSRRTSTSSFASCR